MDANARTTHCHGISATSALPTNQTKYGPSAVSATSVASREISGKLVFLFHQKSAPDLVKAKVTQYPYRGIDEYGVFTGGGQW
jgi:hypothetical protein